MHPVLDMCTNAVHAHSSFVHQRPVEAWIPKPSGKRGALLKNSDCVQVT